jgi:hypothetical protein
VGLAAQSLNPGSPSPRIGRGGIFQHARLVPSLASGGRQILDILFGDVAKELTRLHSQTLSNNAESAQSDVLGAPLDTPVKGSIELCTMGEFFLGEPLLLSKAPDC